MNGIKTNKHNYNINHNIHTVALGKITFFILDSYIELIGKSIFP